MTSQNNSPQKQPACIPHWSIRSALEDRDRLVRNKVLDELKKDLKTRFVSSSNQWSKGRNSGLIECCNIIDELRQKVQP